MRLRELPVAQPVLDTPEKAYEFHGEHVHSAPWYDPYTEAFMVLFLDTRRKICGFALIALGSLDTVVLELSEWGRISFPKGFEGFFRVRNSFRSLDNARNEPPRRGDMQMIEAFLQINQAAASLASELVSKRVIPASAGSDAVHIAVASVHATDFLVTWNFRHIANPFLRDRLRREVADFGAVLPVICTPEELLQDNEND